MVADSCFCVISTFILQTLGLSMSWLSGLWLEHLGVLLLLWRSKTLLNYGYLQQCLALVIRDYFWVVWSFQTWHFITLALYVCGASILLKCYINESQLEYFVLEY